MEILGPTPADALYSQRNRLFERDTFCAGWVLYQRQRRAYSLFSLIQRPSNQRVVRRKASDSLKLPRILVRSFVAACESLARTMNAAAPTIRFKSLTSLTRQNCFASSAS